MAEYIDKQEVRHAAWDLIMPVDGPDRDQYCCSNCHQGALLDYWGDDVLSPYCPTCGAIMDQPGKKYWEGYDGELEEAEDDE